LFFINIYKYNSDLDENEITSISNDIENLKSVENMYVFIYIIIIIIIIIYIKIINKMKILK